MKKVINSPKAPKAIGPYSQAIEVNGISVTINLPNDVDEALENHTEQSLKNIGYILEAAGCTYDNVVKTTCLLSDIANFKAMNEVYAKYFTQDCPARAAFAVKDLPMGALVEIEVVAAK